MAPSTEKKQNHYTPSRSLLLAILVGSSMLSIAGLLFLWRVSESLTGMRVFHAGWLAAVWSYSLLLYRLVHKHGASMTPRMARPVIVGSGVAAVVLPIALPFLGYIERIVPPIHQIRYTRFSQLFFAFMLLVALNGLYYAEKLYRSFYHRGRFRLTIFATIGALSCWMLLCCLALMYRYLDIRAVAASFVPALGANLLLGLHLVRMGPQLEIRQAAARKSVALLVSGIFLLLLGFMAEILRFIEQNLDFFLAFLTAFAVLILSLTVILFGSIKERIQRFIDRNFYKSFYDYQSEWERANRRILPSHDARALQREVLYTVAEAVGADRACLLTQDATGRLYTAASSGLQIDPEQIPPEALDWVWRKGEPVQINDIALDKQEALAPFKESNVRIIVPFSFERQLMALLLLGPAPRRYTHEDVDFLKTLGGHISLALANQKFRESLIESEELKNFNRLSTFILHDLKNASSMLSMILQNADKNLDNPEFRRDMVQTMNGVVERIQRLMRRLSTPLDQHESLEFTPTDLKTLIEETVRMTGVAELSGIQFEAQLAALPPAPVAPFEIQKVIQNLLINAVEAIEKTGKIKITLERRGAYACVEVRDTGCGISEDYIQNALFKPFRTSKAKGLGIGLYQSKSIVEAHFGRIEVESVQGVGSLFRVLLPMK